MLHTALTIAGSDSSGGAGIQADLKTMLSNGVYGMSAITALTAQNTMGVTAVEEATPNFLKQEIDAVFADIYPEAIKVGMVSSVSLIEVIVDRLKTHKAKNIVVDPVMVATSGAALIAGDAKLALGELIKIADVVTPNLAELMELSGKKIATKDDFIAASHIVFDKYGTAVLAKGGHFGDDASDLLVSDKGEEWSSAARIDNPNTHGTGCTLSSAIAANLAKGYKLPAAIARAKDYLTGAIAAKINLGKGRGPLNHGFHLSGKFFF